MKRIGALIWVAASLIAALAVAAPLTAQEIQNQHNKIHYTVHDLGTLGGSFSYAYGLNEKGSVDGIANLSGDSTFHAFLWRRGIMTDLGTLGGPNSSPNTKPNERDEIPGIAETSIPDPYGDHFCPGSGYTCPPTFWTHGLALQLPTLGGINGIASSANNRDQIVGSAENLNPGCRFYFEQKAVMWLNGRITVLRTPVGHSEGYAVGINDEGQIVGWTLTSDCAVFHAALWNKGRVTDLGSLGGSFNVANAINNQGEVIGLSNVSGDITSHAFLWRKRLGMLDLGTLPGDFSSSAWGIDNKGRVVGSSCDASYNCRAFLWQNGVMTDLNSLLPADSQWYLWDAEGINSRGEIVGLAFNVASGEGHAFLATPNGGGSNDAESNSLAMHTESRPRPSFVITEQVRKLLLERNNRRFGIDFTKSQ